MALRNPSSDALFKQGIPGAVSQLPHFGWTKAEASFSFALRGFSSPSEVKLQVGHCGHLVFFFVFYCFFFQRLILYFFRVKRNRTTKSNQVLLQQRKAIIGGLCLRSLNVKMDLTGRGTHFVYELFYLKYTFIQ